MSDRASEALAEASLPGEPRTYDARSKRSGIPLTTLYCRGHGWLPIEVKAEGQLYLTPSEEKIITWRTIRPDFPLVLNVVYSRIRNRLHTS